MNSFFAYPLGVPRNVTSAPMTQETAELMANQDPANYKLYPFNWRYESMPNVAFQRKSALIANQPLSERDVIMVSVRQMIKLFICISFVHLI